MCTALCILPSHNHFDREIPAPCRWVLVPWEFLKFNLLEAGSAQYGAHPWHWNFSQGFPTIAATLLPLGLHGLWLARRCGLLTAPL